MSEPLEKFDQTFRLAVFHQGGSELLVADFAEEDLVAAAEGGGPLLAPLAGAVKLLGAAADLGPEGLGVLAEVVDPRLEEVALILPGMEEAVGDEPVEGQAVLGLGDLEELALEGFVGGFREFLAPARQSGELLGPPRELCDGLGVPQFDHGHLVDGLHEVVHHLVRLRGRPVGRSVEGPPEVLPGRLANRRYFLGDLLGQFRFVAGMQSLQDIGLLLDGLDVEMP